MSFQIKSFNDIVLSQINLARSVTTKITDWAPGSVARTIIEAPAVEVEELYLQMFLGLREAIPVATFLSFGFEKLPAAVARGFVSISASPAPSSSIVIPAGTQFTADDGRVYSSTDYVMWASGQSVVWVAVAYSEAGSVGNIASGLITASDSFGDGYVIGNPAISTGRDIESDAEQEARFAEFIAALSRGTVAACTYAAKQAAIVDGAGNIAVYVARVGVDERPGVVSIYIYSSAGPPPDELLSIAQTLMDGSRDPVTNVITPGYRSAGVRVDVLAMAEREIDLSVAVGMLPGYTLTTEVEQQIGDVFSSSVRAVQPGETLPLGSLVEQLLTVAGVRTIVPATNSNITCAVSEALVPGVLTVTTL